MSCGEEGVKGLGSGEPGVSEDLWASTGWIRLEAAAAHPRPSKLNVAFVGVDRRKPPCPAHFPGCSVPGGTGFWQQDPAPHLGAGVRLGASSRDSNARLPRDAISIRQRASAY